MIEDVKAGPHGVEPLVVVAWMVLGTVLSGKLLSLVLQVENWVGLRLVHFTGLGGRIQALQVPHGKLGEGVILDVAELHSVGVTKSTVWLLLLLLLLLLPAAIGTWEMAHDTRMVYCDGFY